MFDKCIRCQKIGESCVPNLMLLPFDDLIHWCIQRQKYLGLTNHELADKSKVPEGTIGRIKGGDYMDCRYSTIKSMIIALIGGMEIFLFNNFYGTMKARDTGNLAATIRKAYAEENEQEDFDLRMFVQKYGSMNDVYILIMKPNGGELNLDFLGVNVFTV